MEPLQLAATEDTPEIILNPAEKKFKISKISVPENALEFYEPVLQWLKEYEKDPIDETVFDFDLEYVNTASSKQVIQVILLLQQISKKSKVKIQWFYESIDEDMQSLGRRYKNLVEVDFDLIEV